MKFHKNSSWKTTFFHTKRRTDKYYKANSRYSLCERALTFRSAKARKMDLK